MLTSRLYDNKTVSTPSCVALATTSMTIPAISVSSKLFIVLWDTLRTPAKFLYVTPNLEHPYPPIHHFGVKTQSY